MTKNYRSLGVALLVIVGMLTAFALVSQADPPKTEPMQMILENESKYGFDETITLLEKSVKEAGWSVVGSYDYKEILAAKGYDILDIKILELCSGKHSAAILKHDDERMVSPLMPCAISVYKKSDGKTYVAQLNSGAVAAPFGGVIAEVMATVAEETQEIVKDIIK